MKCTVCGADHAHKSDLGVLCDVCWATAMRSIAATKAEPLRTLLEATVRTLEQFNKEHPYQQKGA